MFERLLHGDRQFFDMFTAMAARITGAAKALRRLLAEPARIEQHAAAIKALEREADGIAHDLDTRLSNVFLGPIDSEDIHHLTSELASVIDHIDGMARRAVTFRITAFREPALRLAEVLIGAGERLELALTRVKDTKFVFERSAEVKSLEEEGDAVYAAAVTDLFAGRPDPLEVLRWKELYDQFEDAIDACAHAASVLQRISLKHA